MKNFKYCHVLNGTFANYIEGEQICYLNKRSPLKFVSSYEQIKKEQRLSRKWREKNKFDHMTYQYIKVLIEANQ